MEPIHQVVSYNDVSNELAKKIIKLYGEKVFPRQGKVFADMLFQTGIEAGSFIASLSDIEEKSIKIELGTQALIKLNQTYYLLGVMLDAGFYTPVQVLEIREYVEGLVKAMRDLLTVAYAQMRRERNQRAAAPLGIPQTTYTAMRTPSRGTPVRDIPSGEVIYQGGADSSIPVVDVPPREEAVVEVVEEPARKTSRKDKKKGNGKA